MEGVALQIFVIVLSLAQEVVTELAQRVESITINEMPSHNHDFTNTRPIISTSRGNGSWSDLGGWHDGGFLNYLGIGNTGGGQAMKLLPPYYSLAYIMKL